MISRKYEETEFREGKLCLSLSQKRIIFINLIRFKLLGYKKTAFLILFNAILFNITLHEK